MAEKPKKPELTPEQKKQYQELRKRAEKLVREKEKGNKITSHLPKWLIVLVVVILAASYIYEYLNPSAGLQDGSTVSVSYIDVGQGDSILISSNGQSMLIDCGEAEYSEKVINYINEAGINHLDYVVATHPHSDHMGGMHNIVKAFDIGEIIIPHLNDDDTPTTVYFNKFLDAVGEKNVKLSEAELYREFNVGDAQCTIIAPQSEDYSNKNNYSVGIMLTHGEKKFIFTGDAEKLAEKEMLASEKLSHVDVYKVGHHGSDTSSSDDFLEAISPDIAVISCGKDNSYGHPCDSTLEKLSKYTDKIYRTDICGTVVIVSDGENLTVTTERN